ncbi:ABC transporter permease [Paenibacillus macerans]|uniref:Transport permease protein n=1 Tax=Paenibacillus macerans TaxID=44252 RepID=A0A090ZAT2_PAEMA|nr:ABC transporter permease [Paenibacillus macerans]KFN07737.1 ABC-2 type transporter family protein [Paenibacillus macerans]MCY7561609.1 ABC transporter permease [Paenibacillus macerans]MEC0153357.1 ABC transporter permease [Paenibacillus macerans]SUD25913.1 ABC transporter [Paenibacillus macerans]GBK65186.1 ABC transporter permease [Paenibacillus macerans]
MFNRLKEIIQYRGTIIGLVKRDLKGRYKGSVFGFFWNLIFPLSQILVYILVFSQVFKHDVPNYYLFLVVAMMPWLTFTECMQQGGGSIVGQSSLVSKIYFPNEILPISTVIARFINLLLTFVIVFVLIFIGGQGFNPEALLYLPLVIMIEFIMALGITIILSAITVYFRDVQYIVQMLLMAGVWVTPVLFEPGMVKGFLASIMAANPLSPVITAFRQILYYKESPDMPSLWMAAGFSVVLLIIALVVFRKLESGFAEEI